jgi:hypothetical protein
MHSDRRRFFLTEPDGITDDLSGIRGRVAAGPLTGRRRDARGGPVAQAVHGPHAAGHREGRGNTHPEADALVHVQRPCGRVGQACPATAGAARRRGDAPCRRGRPRVAARRGGLGPKTPQPGPWRAPAGAFWRREGSREGVPGPERARTNPGGRGRRAPHAQAFAGSRPSPRAVACPLPPGARASFPHAFVYTPGGRPTPHPPERVQRGAEPFPKTLTIPACYDHNILPTG